MKLEAQTLIQLTNMAAGFKVEAAESEGKPSLPRFSMVAYTGMPMRVGGWRYPVVVDLAGLSIPAQSLPIRFGHDSEHGVGHTEAIKIENDKLLAAGVISRDTPAAKEVVASSRNGFPWQASIGAGVEQHEFIQESKSVRVNGHELQGPLNVIRKSVLGEISFVDLGADRNTTAQVAASAFEPNFETQEKPHVETAEKTNPVSVEAQAPIAPVVADPIADMRVKAATETRRIAMIQSKAAKFPELAAQGIAEGWDQNKIELEVMRAERPTAPNAVIRGDSRDDLKKPVLEAACAITADLHDVESEYDEQTLDAAHKAFPHGISLHQLLLTAAIANGYTGRQYHDHKEIMRFAFASNVNAAFSSIDIGGILSNVANKFLLEGFYSVERTWRNICAVRNVTDFKTVTSYRMTGANQYELVAPGGELKHGKLGEEKYQNKADTYGLMLSIARKDIINNDLGSFTQMPRIQGRGAGLALNEIFWKVFMANAAFFSVANKNYLSGADTALSIDGLTKAEVAFLDQVDGDGKPIGVMPSILLVPTALTAVASQLNKALEIRDNTAAKYPTSNPHQGKFRAEVSRYLSNPNIQGNSSKAWHLLADPRDVPVIEVAFLNGQESPTIETAEADFNVLGIQMRGYHDFGVALQDPRGGVKSKGEV